MNGYLARRVAKLEDRRRPRIIVPSVVEHRHDETQPEAMARFRDRYAGHIQPRHAVLFVPTWPTIDAFAAEFKAQQLGLLEWVRAHHPKETAQC